MPSGKEFYDDYEDDQDEEVEDLSETNLLRDTRWLNALAETCERIDRILAGNESVNCQFSTGPSGVPAYQEGNRVTFVPSEIEKMVNNPHSETEVIPTVLGLNLHEYGHLDFTPTPTNPVWERERVRLQDYYEYRTVMTMLNVLEDQRQELLTSIRYPKARNYFRYTMLRSMVSVMKDRGEIPAENFVLYYGRRHILPNPLIDRLEMALVKKYDQASVTRAKEIVDEYVRIAATNDAALLRMFQLSEELKNLFKEIGNMAPGREPCVLIGRIGARVSKSTQGKASKGVGELLDAVDAHIELQDGEDAPTAPKGSLEDLIGDYLQKTAAKLASETGDRSAEIRQHIYGVAAQRLARIFEEVATDLHMRDFSRLRRGKLDIRRLPALVARGDMRVFRYRQQSLEDMAQMLIHVMCDVSGSMGHNVRIALDATATIARAAELAGHLVKVSTFASDSATLKDWHEPKMRPTSYVGGGTNPTPLFEAMGKDFEEQGKAARKVNYVTIVITDGIFSDPAKDAQLFREFKARQDGHVFLIGINAPVSGYTTYSNDYTPTQREFKVDASIEIKSANDLERVMRRALKRLALDITRSVHRKYGFGG